MGERAGAIIELESPYIPRLTATDIPFDLLTASASGLDPDITPAAAEFQAPRIAAVKGISLDQVLSLIDEHTKGRSLGVLGQTRINVLELNLALRQLGEGSS
jgi:K+-transporting ATPase ATPase C chain